MEMQDKYVPGVCNIGRTEIKRRKRVGWSGLIATVVLWALFVGFDVSAQWRLILFIPATISAAGFLQARMRFCAYYGFASLFNFTADAKTESIQQSEYRAADRLKAWQITLLAPLIGVAFCMLAIAIS